MSLEASRHGLQLELSRARLVQFAERLVFPNHPHRRHADGRFIFACIAAIRRMARGLAIRDHLSFDGRHPCHARLHPGARTDRARLAHFTDAFDLPADAQLLHLESDSASGQRRLGELGQTRAHSKRASASVEKEWSARRRPRIWDVSRISWLRSRMRCRRRRGHANKNACFLGESHMRNSTSEARWKSIAESKGLRCGYLREGVEG